MRRVVALTVVISVLACTLLAGNRPARAESTLLPDLLVSSAALVDGKVHYVVKNSGFLTCPGGFTCALWVDGKPVTEDVFAASLKPGDAGEDVFPAGWSPSPGKYAVQVIADVTQQVNESNEGNNAWQGVIIVEEPEPPPVSLPDLVPSRLALSEDGHLQFQVTNASRVPLPAGWRARAGVWFDGQSVGSVDLSTPTSTTGGGIGQPGGRSTYLTLWVVEHSTLVRIMVDSGRDIEEANEQNNSEQERLGAVADTMPPAFTTGPVVTQIGRTAATVVWSTDEPSVGVVAYGAGGVHEHTGGSPGPAVAHSLLLTGLNQGTTYLCQITARDAMGNSATSRLFSFTTQGASDTVPPQVRLLLPPTLAGLTTLKPQVSDDKGVDRVVFSLDGVPRWTDFSDPFEWPVDVSRLSDGQHTIGVTAFDSAGNRTDFSGATSIRNRAPVELSPVNVTISTPESGAVVEFPLDVVAVLSDDFRLPLTRAELRINGALVHTVTYADESEAVKGTAWPVPPPGAVSRLFRYAWDSSLPAGGSELIIEVTAYDSAGNAGTDQVIATRAVVPQPEWDIERTVTRDGNRFLVELTVRNTAADPAAMARSVVISDISRGFLAISTVRTPSYDPERSEVTCRLSLPELAPGSSARLSYELLPAMYDPELDDYTVGLRTEIGHQVAYGAAASVTLREPYYPGDNTSLPYPLLPAEVAEVFRSVDYLMVTDPARLQARFGQADADQVLQTVAVLAKYRNAVPALRRGLAAWPSAAGIKANLLAEGIWSGRMDEELLASGYLLLVGETDVVPSFDYRGAPQCFGGYGCVTVIRDSDHPYSVLSPFPNNSQPDLRVGRIIGASARELMAPMQASIGVAMGRFVNDRSNAALISGPEGTWEHFIQQADEFRALLAGQGLATEVVHAEYHTTEVELLREALVIRGDFECPGDPGHRVGGVACTKTHPPTTLDALHALITVDEAETIEADRRLTSGEYTLYGTLCTAGSTRGTLTKMAVRGKDLIFWGGHGGPGSWAWVLDGFIGSCGEGSDMYTENAVSPLTFGSTRPVVFAGSCLTGNYTAEADRSIARTMLTHGAAVYIGATEVSPSNIGPLMAEWFLADYWNGPGIRVGDAMAALKEHMMLVGGPDYLLWAYLTYEYNLYGDPKFGGR